MMQCILCKKFMKTEDNPELFREKGIHVHSQCFYSDLNPRVKELLTDNDDMQVLDMSHAFIEHLAFKGPVYLSDFVKSELDKVEKKSKPKKKRAPGAGRPKIGDSKKLSINLPEGEWENIDSLIESRIHETYAEYFRHLHMCNRMGITAGSFELADLHDSNNKGSDNK